MLKTLTSFRFIAAFMVFLFHMAIFNKFQLGAAGVSFFFILSGFILTFNYHSKFLLLNKRDINYFYRARFAKIYPIHLLTFLISIPLVIIDFHPHGLYFIKFGIISTVNLLLCQSFVPSQGTYFNFNGVSWTLSIEAFFYFMFPFLIWFSTKLKVKKNLTVSSLIMFLIYIVLLMLNKSLNENNGFQVWLLHIFPLTRLFEFYLGILVCLVFLSKPNKTTNGYIFSILELMCLLIGIGMLLYSVRINVSIVRSVYFIPLWCTLIYVFAFQKGFISKVLSNNLLVYLGNISFSFYMIHQLVIRYINYMNLSAVANFSICLGLTLLISGISYQFYEEPLRKVIRFGFKSKKKIQIRVSA